MRNRIYQYYAEGQDEIRVLNVLKSELCCIQSGKMDVFNAVQNRLTDARTRMLKNNTIVVLVYDTDVEKTDILRENIRLLENHPAVKEVICIPQLRNLEEELVRACQIRNAAQLTGSVSKKDFKRDLIRCANLGDRLRNCGFNIDDFWAAQPKNAFSDFKNGAEKIKKKI